MTTLQRLVLAALIAIPLTACSGDNGTDPDTDDTADTGTDATDDSTGDADDDGSDTGGDSGETDTTDATEVDGGDEDVVETVPCDEDEECPEDTICVEGACESLRCGNANDWVKCQDLFNRLGDERGRYATCAQNRCRESCYFDTDCPTGDICTNFGECQPFTGDLTVDYPHGPATGTLRAGVSNIEMNYPVGVPLGGYGQRAAYNDGRYAVSLKASVGQFGGFYSRGLLLDNGERRLMIIRLPVIFTSMAFHEEVARVLQERTGDDWRHSIVISSTHTHSGPCRHWHLPIEAAAPLGSFGIGEFSQQFYDWLRDTAVETAMAAMDDLAPARIGWEIVEAFDMDDQVGRDRWNASPPFDDNRALLLRVDDEEGVPRASLISFGAHGTDNDTDFLTGDGIGFAETAFEDALGERFGRFIPSFYVNQNSGTMGPAGGSHGHDFPMKMERLGYAFVEKTLETFLEMETTDQLTLNSRNIRFPISYDLLGYDRGQFAGDFDPPFGGEYHFGGLQCVGTHGGDSDFATHQTVEDMSCGGAIHFLLYNNPPTTLTRSSIMAIELNGLTIMTMPGELSMELSWEVLRALRDDPRFEVDPLSAWTWGYANDHLFYLLPTNLRGERPPFPGISTPMAPDDYPNFAFSYLQGAYESTMSMWGPNQGDFLVARAVDAYAAMHDPDFVPPLPQPLPDQYSPRDEPAFEIDTTPAALVGTTVIEMPATVTRFEAVEFGWVGGDPGAEQPQVPRVTLERNGEGGFEPVLRPNTMPYTNYENGLFVTRVRRPVEDGPWEWIVRWEELGDFPTADYRFRIEGHYLDETTGRTSYTLHSPTFSLVPSEALLITASVSEGSVVGTVGFPPEERGRFNGPSTDPGRVTGNYRMRHPMVPTGVPSPVADLEPSGVQVRVFDGETLVAEAFEVEINAITQSAGGRSNVPATQFVASFSELTAGTYDVEVTITDEHGNTGTETFALAF